MKKKGKSTYLLGTNAIYVIYIQLFLDLHQNDN